MPEHRVVDFRANVDGKRAWRAGLKGLAVEDADARLGVQPDGEACPSASRRARLTVSLNAPTGGRYAWTTYKNQLEAPLTHLMLAEVHSKIQSARLMARANAGGDGPPRCGAIAAGTTARAGVFAEVQCARVLVETAYVCQMVRRGDRAAADATPDPPPSWKANPYSVRGATHASITLARRAEPGSACGELRPPDGRHTATT